MRKMNTIRLVAAILVVCCMPAFAALRTITSGTIRNLDGTTWNGTFKVTMAAATSQPLVSGGVTLSTATINAKVVSGIITSPATLQLYANDAITPAGTSYRVEWFPTLGQSWLETWLVPTGSGSVDIGTIRVTTVPTPTVTFGVSQINGSTTIGNVLTSNGTAAYWAAPAGGAISSITLAMPSALFGSTTGSPLTASGTLAPTLATQAANCIVAGPTTGANATPTCRAQVAADMPANVPTYYTDAGSDAGFSISAATSGRTLGIAWNANPAGNNKVYASNGLVSAPSFRSLVAADIPTLNQSTTGNAATATALAANGANCSAGNYPLGVDASGNVETCTAAATLVAGDVTGVFASTVVGKLNGVALSGLATGILKNTTTSGVPSIAIAADFPTLNQSTTGSAATATALQTPRAINGVNFDGSAAITVTAAAGTLSGATLASGVTASSLTSFGAAPALGTPASATLTNATGLPISTGVSGLGTGVATFAATPSSANFAAAITDESGTGLVILQTSPTIVTPTIASTGWTNATHAHAAANSGGQIALSALTGSVACSQMPALTGDATTGAGACAVTVGKINGVALSALATGLVKNTTTTGVPSIAVNSDLPAMSATVGGAVPTPPNNTTTFLRGDGTFSAPAAVVPGGSNTDVQINNAGAFGPATGVTYDLTNRGLVIATLGTGLSITQTAVSGGAPTGLIYTGAVNTNQTASTEIPAVKFTTAGRQWATGALATQRAFLITQPTYSFVGASTITDAATVGIAGAPIKSTNATITNTHGLLIGAGAVSTATNSYGLTVNAQTGATNNYAAQLFGLVGFGLAAPTFAVHIAPTTGITANKTLFVQDATPTTGSTEVVVQAGAGQSSNTLMEWRNNAGTMLALVSAVGGVYGTAITATGVGGVNAGSTYLFFSASTTFHNRSDGVVTLSNYAENDFGRLQLGGTTSSFPAIKRNAAGLDFRLADDSAYANTQAAITKSALFSMPTTGAAATSGNATLVAGTVTVNTTAAVTSSSILLTRKTSGGTIGTALTYTINSGVSITVTSDNVLDTSVITYLIVATY